MESVAFAKMNDEDDARLAGLRRGSASRCHHMRTNLPTAVVMILAPEDLRRTNRAAALTSGSNEPTSIFPEPSSFPLTAPYDAT